MRIRPGKLLLIALVPVALYGVAKGLMYMKAKGAVDDIVTAAANQADIRYSGIDTDIRGAVTVKGVTITPRGYTDQVQIDAVRIDSNDPMFFIGGWDWQPGESEPPDHLSLQVTGLRMPIDTELFAQYAAAREEAGEASDPCVDGPSLEPALLKELGFSELVMDFGGHYRLDKTNLTLTAGWEMDVKDLQAMQMSIDMSDVDTQTLNQGAPPQMNLAAFEVAIDVSPEFGRQALKNCAIGTDLTIDQLSERYAERFIAKLETQGVSLGSGLQRAVRDFYRDWGTVRVVAAPAEPVGLLSMMFLPPDRLADALSLRLSLNDKLITDTRFSWQGGGSPGLSQLFGSEPVEAAEKAKAAPRRIVVRREYETIATADLGGYIDHNVRLKPRGQPMREGLLKRIRNGEAEVEQTLHGGKFTVYVPLRDIASAEALIQREVKSLP
jgi:hypothetical protein